MSRLPEVLAPAGNPAALEAAVLCGCLLYTSGNFLRVTDFRKGVVLR